MIKFIKENKPIQPVHEGNQLKEIEPVYDGEQLEEIEHVHEEKQPEPEEMKPVGEEKENVHEANNPSKKSKINTIKENAIANSDGTCKLKAHEKGIQPEKLEPVQ